MSRYDPWRSLADRTTLMGRTASASQAFFVCGSVFCILRTRDTSCSIRYLIVGGYADDLVARNWDVNPGRNVFPPVLGQLIEPNFPTPIRPQQHLLMAFGLKYRRLGSLLNDSAVFRGDCDALAKKEKLVHDGRLRLVSRRFL